MPVSERLDKEWIDQNYSYLEPRLGTFPLFEPSPAFYDNLAGFTGADPQMHVVYSSLQALYTHLGLPALPVHFENHIPNAGEFRFSEHPENREIIVPVCIRIADKYRQIGDPQRRGMAIGAILAHEITHYFMLKKKIRRETADNERLTDLGLVVLGLAKLWFNGRDLIVGDRPEQLGYLSPLDMSYAYMEYAKRNRVTDARLRDGLTPPAVKLFSFWLGQVMTEVRASRELEERENKQETVRVLAAEQAALEKQVQKLITEPALLQQALASAVRDQDIISRTHAFWGIRPEDDRILGAFVTAHASGTFETGLRAATGALDRLGGEVSDLGTGLQQPTAINCDPAIFRKIQDTQRQTFASLADRMTALQQQVAEAAVVHGRCFARIGSLQRDAEEIRELVRASRMDRDTIASLHAFLTENPAAWPAYFNDRQLQERVLASISPGTEDSLASTEAQLEEAGLVCSLPRPDYAMTLGRFPPLAEIHSRLPAVRAHAARSRQRFAEVLAKQGAVPETYLGTIRDLERQLQEIKSASRILAREIAELKPRQDRIHAGHDRLEVTPEDGKVFAEITHAVLSAAPEGEFLAHERRAATLSAALVRDAGRVKGLRDAAEILPPDTHREAFDDLRFRFGTLSGRVSRWRQVQQAYLDRLDAWERPSVANFLRDAGDRIRDTFRRWKR